MPVAFLIDWKVTYLPAWRERTGPDHSVFALGLLHASTRRRASPALPGPGPRSVPSPRLCAPRFLPLQRPPPPPVLGAPDAPRSTDPASCSALCLPAAFSSPREQTPDVSPKNDAPCPRAGRRSARASSPAQDAPPRLRLRASPALLPPRSLPGPGQVRSRRRLLPAPSFLCHVLPLDFVLRGARQPASFSVNHAFEVAGAAMYERRRFHVCSDRPEFNLETVRKQLYNSFP